ncbi:MAG: 3-keto-5-aminohexanoate cleavage protein [Deltaproteobacteria bacterium 13_1_40CM_68_24]|nr:MAG: 3-keto-5-aminohexanoate cleavage protein [Deltaproteobacteria bacterium 13_1_40CM_68_24]OLC77262.1 MAG: 3-keto-5-aminohexanoate cleavage protein [Deltaproteobacteria bacterium 13_1_40CM_4_68_19]OLD07064.1 MAG: 3-keto-5-aminohexanoate cleavage protein [Deltaproteobacteria bacterium 13_1_40CM_3_69_14]
MTPAIITAAICGAETTREMTPHLPITADELAQEAVRCREAGASVIHLHVRRDDGTPTQDRALFQKALDAIRGRTDAIVQTSTGGAVGMTADERAQPLECTPPPEMATLNAGSLNFGDDVFLNPFPLVREFARRMRAKGIAYELECYDVGHVEACLRLAEEGVIGLPAHFDFVMGVRGGIQASEDNLTFLVMKLPKGCTFNVAGIGRHQLPMAELSLRMGGHARCGLEDNIYSSKGVLAKGSFELVARVAELARAAGREIATPAQAREILRIPGRPR